MTAPTILSRQARRGAAPDLSPESIDFLVRERAIIEAARYGFNREEAKRLIFQGWRLRQLRRRELEEQR